MEKRIKVQIPMLPNYLVDTNGNQWSLSKFSEEELRELGAEWIEALVAKSKRIPV